MIIYVCVYLSLSLCNICMRVLDDRSGNLWKTLSPPVGEGVHAGQQLMVKNPMDGSSFLITVPLGTGPGLQAIIKYN